MKNIINLGLLFIFLGSTTILSQEVKIIKPEPEIYFEGFESLHQMDEETEKQYLKALEAQTKAELQQIKEYDKQRYSELLMEAYFNSHRFPRYGIPKSEKDILEREKSISMHEISVAAMTIKYKHAKDSEKEVIRKELNRVLYQLFDLKEKSKKMEIKMLEEELTKLKKSISIREKNRDKIVERRLQDLIGDGDFLEW